LLSGFIFFISLRFWLKNVSAKQNIDVDVLHYMDDELMNALVFWGGGCL